MSFEELKEQGIILAEEEWGRRSLESSASRRVTAAVLVGATAAIAVAWAADGGWVTWVALAFYIVGFLALALVFHRAAGTRRPRRRREGDESLTRP